MESNIITVASWHGTLTHHDVSQEYDAEHPYMAFDKFDGPDWNALRLVIPNDGTYMTSLKKDLRKDKHPEIGNYFSSKAKAEIEAILSNIEVRNMQ